MADADIPKLAAWVRSKHARAKHALILVEGYDPVDIAMGLLTELQGASEITKVDLIVGDLWVCIRVLLPKMPAALLRDPNLAVCTITPE